MGSRYTEESAGESAEEEEMTNTLEALADGIMAFEGWHVGSRSYRNRNPGNLRPTSASEPQDADGYRIFDSLIQGYTALLMDLTVKISGQGHWKLGPLSTVADLMNIYAPSSDNNDPNLYAAFLASWVSKALGEPVLPSTTLGSIWKGPSNEIKTA